MQDFPGFAVDSFCWFIMDGSISPLEFLISSIYLPLIDDVISYEPKLRSRFWILQKQWSCKIFFRARRGLTNVNNLNLNLIMNLFQVKINDCGSAGSLWVRIAFDS